MLRIGMIPMKQDIEYTVNFRKSREKPGPLLKVSQLEYR